MTKVKGEPSRGPKPRTSRARIVAKAVRIVDRDGAEALTMRRLADSCDLSPMGLYRYMRDRDELLDLVVESVLETIPSPRLSGRWERKVARLFGDFRAMCLRHPGVVALGVSRVTPVPAMARFTDEALGLMDEAGLRGQASLMAYDSLLMFTIGSVLWQAPRTGRERSRLLEAAAGSDRPAANLQRHAAELGRRSPDRYFDYGLSLLIDGIAANAGRTQDVKGPPK